MIESELGLPNQGQSTELAALVSSFLKMHNFLEQSQPGNHFTVSIAAKSARKSVTKLLQPTQAFLYVVPHKIWPLLSPPLPFFLLSVQRGPNNGGNGLFAPARKRWFLGSCCTRRHRFLIKKRFLSLSSSSISPRLSKKKVSRHVTLVLTC